MQDPKPFHVIRGGRFAFTIHAHSEQQARDLIAARLSDTADVVVLPVSTPPVIHRQG